MRATQFVGRQAQLDYIQQHLYHVLTGQPRVVLVEGLAGIGKSRFLEQVRTMADQLGFQVSAGRGDEMFTQPYAPFADLLFRLEAEHLLDEPDIAVLHDFLDRAVLALPQGAADQAESDKLGLMMTVSRAMAKLVLRTPMVLILDDLYLADQSSLDLFAYLIFALAEEEAAPVLFLASYRPVTSDSHLGATLSRLRQEEMVRAIELDGVDEADTRVLLRELGVRQPTQQLVSSIHEATHGIPLFIEEIVPHLIQSGAVYAQGGDLFTRPCAVDTLELPPNLSDAIAVRLQSLPASSYPILTLAACLGETFSIEHLQSVSQVDAETIRDVLEVGIEHGVLIGKAGHWRFAHTLIRHAFQLRLTPDQRRRLHLQISQAFERLYATDPDTHILEITHHLVEAGELADAQTVITYAQQAGDRAFTIFAWREAARYYEAALAAAESTSDVSDRQRADLHYQAGLAHYRNQDESPALDHFDRAEQVYRDIGDRRGLANTLIWQSILRFMRGSLPIGVIPDMQSLYDVLETLGDTDPGLSGNLVVVLSQLHRQARQSTEADALAQRARALGRQANDHRICAAAYNALGLASLSQLQVESAIWSWQESSTHAQLTDDLWRHSLPLLNLPLALNLKGDLEEAELTALEGAEIAKSIQDWGGYSKALSHLASISVAKGDFGNTERHAEETLRMVERSRYPWSGLRALQALAGSLAVRGLRAEAEQALEKIVQPGVLFDPPGRFEQVLVRVFRQLSRVYGSEQLTEYIAPLHDELMEVVKHDTYSLAPLCAMIELGEQTLMPAFTERPAAILSDAMEQGVLFTSGWCFLIPRVLGVAAVMQEEWEQAGAYFAHAIREAQQMEAWPELARAYLDYARMELLIQDTDDPTWVLDLLEHASILLNEFGMMPHAKLVFEMKDNILSPRTSPDVPETQPPGAEFTLLPPRQNGMSSSDLELG